MTLKRPRSRFPSEHFPPGLSSPGEGLRCRSQHLIGAPNVSVSRDDNVVCRMLILAQSNTICSVFLPACSLRSIKLITVLGFGSGRAKRGEMGEEEGTKQGIMAF